MLKIVNATPLIYLAKLGKLTWINILYPSIITTSYVRDEVLNKDAPEYHALLDAFNRWIKIEEIQKVELLDQLQASHNIEVGEASIILLAIEKAEETMLFIDDKIARTVAKSFGFQVTGTLGIILDAIFNSLITRSEALQLIDQLALHTPFRMSLELYKLITEKIKEMK
jgi:hypothetical protein